MDLQTRCRLFEVNNDRQKVVAVKVVKLLLKHDKEESEALLLGMFPGAELRQARLGACCCLRGRGRCRRRVPISSYTAVCSFHYANTARTYGTTIPPFTDIDFQTWRICENASLRRHRRERERYAVLGIQMQRLLVSMQFINLEEQTLPLEFDSLQRAVYDYWYQRWDFVHRPRPLTVMNLHSVLCDWHDLRDGLHLPVNLVLAKRTMGLAATRLFDRFRALATRIEMARDLWDEVYHTDVQP